MSIGTVLPWQTVLCLQDIQYRTKPDVPQYGSFAHFTDCAVKEARPVKGNLAVEECYFAMFDVLKTVVTKYSRDGEIWYQLNTGFIRNDLVSLVTVRLQEGDYLYLCFINKIDSKLPLAGKSLVEMLNESQVEIKLSGYYGDDHQPYAYFEKMPGMLSDQEYAASAISALLQTVILSCNEYDIAWTPVLEVQRDFLSKSILAL
ncbi:hypothetical protein D8Z79_006015 [Escherichia fergusonii]|uniref:hypothetical protein n=1 Tax=Escherichia fergusonii TaxID=564 RepID=UPI000F66A977|nr:hypothetical protein [Escherichia fergusonii]MBA8500736.1 hypothetical protein [Escherichia fergusonii]QCZ31448.1 hypothetical protein D8Z79_006015 [Escherichia fergusonii]